MAVSGRYYHMLKVEEMGADVVPFFDMVYRDCIALHGKYEHDVTASAEQVLHHVAMGRPLYYHLHMTRNHLYYKDGSEMAEQPLPAANAADASAFTRAHNGWAEGLCLYDRYMKNTHEVLSPLHKLTAQTLVADYAFLDAEHKVRRTTYDNGVTTVVNAGDAPYTVASALGGEVVLPPYGLLVEAETFCAFHALSWAGHKYTAPVLFTLTSLDGQPLARSQAVRVFHGFGDEVVCVRGQEVGVKREAVI